MLITHFTPIADVMRAIGRLMNPLDVVNYEYLICIRKPASSSR